LWVIRKKEPLSRWLACATFPLLINICSYCPTSFLFLQKMCQHMWSICVEFRF
jgi:hypothetical protein